MGETNGKELLTRESPVTASDDVQEKYIDQLIEDQFSEYDSSGKRHAQALVDKETQANLDYAFGWMSKVARTCVDESEHKTAWRIVYMIDSLSRKTRLRMSSKHKYEG